MWEVALYQNGLSSDCHRASCEGKVSCLQLNLLVDGRCDACTLK